MFSVLMTEVNGLPLLFFPRYRYESGKAERATEAGLG